MLIWRQHEPHHLNLDLVRGGLALVGVGLTRPAPYPADTKAKGWRFELDLERVTQSDTWALAAEIAMAQQTLLMMWTVAWMQVPCGSMPADPDVIRAKVKVPPKLWAPMRDVVLRGWWLADDGRLYHDVIAERVIGMLEVRCVDRARQDARRNQFESIRDRDGRACVYCGHTKYLTLDHILPLSRGGDNDERNLAIACRPCNSKKKDRTPEEAGMPFISMDAAGRWESYKKSAGEKRSKTEQTGRTQRNDTGTGTGTINTNTPPPTRASLADVEVFAMQPGWQPSEAFKTTAKLSGLVIADELKAAGIAEFVAYWLTQPGTVRNQAEWEHALVKSLKRDAAQAKPASTSSKPARKGSHTGFENIDYTAGVLPDGRLA